MTPDEQRIRLSEIRKRMRELSVAGEETAQVEVQIEGAEEGDVEKEEFILRCEARQVIHEYVAYERQRTGSEWKIAISILKRGFESKRFGFEDEFANSMLGLQSILEKNGD